MSFKRDVKGLFSKYAADMGTISLPIPKGEGTAELNLGDYDSVKLFYYPIQVAIHGYDYDADVRATLSDAQLLRDTNGQLVTSAPHPMPVDNRLPQQAIDIYDQWVRDGMPP
jgi:hypothetical protein